MIKVGFGEMYDDISYGIEQNVLHRSLPSLRYVRDLSSLWLHSFVNKGRSMHGVLNVN